MQSLFGGFDLHTTHHVFPRIPWQKLIECDGMVMERLGHEKYKWMEFTEIVVANWEAACGTGEEGICTEGAKIE